MPVPTLVSTFDAPRRPGRAQIRFAFATILGLGLGLAACAHRREADPSPAAAPDDAVARFARENAALRRRIEMLEDRVLQIEHGGQRAGPSDGRALPVTKLEPPRETTTPARTRAKTLGTMPGPAMQEPPEEGMLDDDAPTPSATARSYRLEGSRLVELTQRGGPKAPDRPSTTKSGKTIVAQYEAAMEVYRAGSLPDAERAFESFARAHPRHDYADNAIYWKGEAAYDQAHYADALAAFTEVVERYGGGNKAADALLKIGLCYRELGDDDNAQDVLTQLIAAYPGERASDIARIKLAEFDPSHPRGARGRDAHPRDARGKTR